MRDKVVKKLLKNGCTNIISLNIIRSKSEEQFYMVHSIMIGTMKGLSSSLNQL